MVGRGLVEISIFLRTPQFPGQKSNWQLHVDAKPRYYRQACPSTFENVHCIRHTHLPCLPVSRPTAVSHYHVRHGGPKDRGVGIHNDHGNSLVNGFEKQLTWSIYKELQSDNLHHILGFPSRSKDIIQFPSLKPPQLRRVKTRLGSYASLISFILSMLFCP